MNNFLSIVLAIIISTPIAWRLSGHHFESEEYPKNGIYMTTNYNGANVCAYDSPWKKGGGGSEFFYIEKDDPNLLICKLWTGSSHDLERFNDGRAFQTIEEANQKLKKNFVRGNQGNYIRIIKRRN